MPRRRPTGRRRGAAAAALSSGETLRGLGQALDRSSELGAVARRIADSVAGLFAARLATVFRLDPDTGDLVAVATSPATDRDRPVLHFPVGTGAVGLAVRQRAPVATDDLADDPRLRYAPEARGQLERGEHGAVLALPLLIDDHAIGALAIVDARGRRFTPAEIELGRVFADQVALALQNAGLSRALARRLERLETLERLNRLISSSLEMDEVLRAIARAAATLMGAPQATFWVLGDRPGTLVARAWADEAMAGEPGAATAASDAGPLGWVVAHRRLLNVPDVSAEAHLPPLPWWQAQGLTSFVGLPILLEESVVAVLALNGRHPFVMTPADERLLESLVAQAAIAIRNARLFGAEQRARTEVETAARALRDSERRYRSLFESANDPIAIFALDGTLTAVNPEVERVTGYAPAEMIGQHYARFITRASATAVEERARRSAAGERLPPTIQAVVVLKDGTERVVEGRIAALRDDAGRVTGWQMMYRDMTERLRADAALRASEERYRGLVEGSIQGLHIHREGRTLFANTAFARMLGYATAAELIGCDLRHHVAPSDRPRVEGLEAARLRGEPVPSRYEVEGVRTDGTPIWLEVLASAVAWDGAPAIQATLLDVTDRKRTEAALRQAQKMEAVGQLAGGVAHDFNNLLTVITGRGDLLLRRLRPDDPARRDVELIRKTADRAVTLTQQLLAFSRKQLIQPRVLDLNEVVAGLAPMLRRLIGENITVVTLLDPALDLVVADPAQIEQIALNCSVNARDAMPGGGTLTIETANVDLDEAFVRAHPGATAGAHALLAIADTGCGMTPEVQAHMFEPFFTTKEVGKGTGLGLSTVYGIVKQHRGYVGVDSAPGRGTVMRVYLPRAEAVPGQPADAAVEVAPGIHRGAGTVLVAEDEDDLRDFAREVLETAGYAVLAAAHPDEALELAERHAGPLDLLLTDVVMPRMSGRDLAERLLPSHPAMKVLYMSGYTDEAIVHHGVLDPGTAFLQKPFTPDGLTRRIREILETHGGTHP